MTKEKYEEIYDRGYNGSSHISVGEDVEDFVQQIINNRVRIHSYGEYDEIYNGEKPITLKDNNGSKTVNTSLEPFNPQGRQFYLKFIDRFTERTSFHLALLTSQEKSQLAKNDENYIKTFLPKPFYLNNEHVKHMSVYNPSVDVPKAEMNASESKRKYALSKCTRRTYILVPSDSSSLRQKCIQIMCTKIDEKVKKHKSESKT